MSSVVKLWRGRGGIPAAATNEKLTTSAKLQPRKAGDNFVAIRLIAALLVIFGHSFPLTGGEGPGYLGSPVSTLAVKVFFVISGYLISESWMQDANVARYLCRRALRIFPALSALCLLTVLLVGPALTQLNWAEYFGNPGTWDYLENVILKPNYALPGMFGANLYPGAVNGSLWTLPVEFSMYLLTPVLMILPRKGLWICLTALGLSAASVWFNRIAIPAETVVVWGTNLVSWLEMAPYFVWGIVYRLWLRPGFLNVQVAMVLLLLLPLGIYNWASAEVVSLLIVPYVTLSLGQGAPPRFAWLERIGDLSYGIYLYGFLVQQVVASFFLTPGHHWMNFLLAAPISVILGALSWHFVEKPAMRLKPSRPLV